MPSHAPQFLPNCHVAIVSRHSLFSYFGPPSAGLMLTAAHNDCALTWRYCYLMHTAERAWMVCYRKCNICAVVKFPVCSLPSRPIIPQGKYYAYVGRRTAVTHIETRITDGANSQMASQKHSLYSLLEAVFGRM